MVSSEPWCGVFLRISAIREDGAGVLSVAIEMGQRPCSKDCLDFCMRMHLEATNRLFAAEFRAYAKSLADLNQPSEPSPAATE